MREVLTPGVTVVPVLPVGQFTATELRALVRLIRERTVKGAGNDLRTTFEQDAADAAAVAAGRAMADATIASPATTAKTTIAPMFRFLTSALLVKAR